MTIFTCIEWPRTSAQRKPMIWTTFDRSMSTKKSKKPCSQLEGHGYSFIAVNPSRLIRTRSIHLWSRKLRANISMNASSKTKRINPPLVSALRVPSTTTCTKNRNHRRNGSRNRSFSSCRTDYFRCFFKFSRTVLVRYSFCQMKLESYLVSQRKVTFSPMLFFYSPQRVILSVVFSSFTTWIHSRLYGIIETKTFRS